MPSKVPYVDAGELTSLLVLLQDTDPNIDQATLKASRDRLGEIFLLMSNRIIGWYGQSKHHANINRDIDDAIQEATMLCLSSVNKFKCVLPNGKKSNAFAYFSSVIFNASRASFHSQQRGDNLVNKYKDHFRSKMSSNETQLLLFKK